MCCVCTALALPVRLVHASRGKTARAEPVDRHQVLQQEHMLLQYQLLMQHHLLSICHPKGATIVHLAADSHATAAALIPGSITARTSVSVAVTFGQQMSSVGANFTMFVPAVPSGLSQGIP